jgi:monoamine oxidase
MGRTPLMRLLRQLAAEHHQAYKTSSPVEAVREREARRLQTFSRREFLAVGAAAAAATLVPMGLGNAAPRRAQPRIAIIGAGLAGLTAALTLRDQGYTATIYEALERVGGRTRSDGPSTSPSDGRSMPACGSCHAVSRSVEPIWQEGQVTDVFGELIDSGHQTMLALAKRFKLPLIDLLAAEPAAATETYYFLGQRYPKAQADRDFAALYPAILDDVRAAGYPTTYNRSKPGGRALDSMSIYEWIERRVPGGHANPFGMLLDVAYNIEFGAETWDQSALNLLYLLGYSPSRTSFSVYGTSDERYRIAAGIETLPRAIASSLGASSPIYTAYKLQRIAARSGGGYDLVFGTGFPNFRSEQRATADIVIMTVPFAALRTLDYESAGFDALKTKAIRELGAGHNGKLHLQFTKRFWNDPGPWGVSGGTSYADTGYQTTWEATRGQPGASGILVNYTGGLAADALNLQHPYGNVLDGSAGVNRDADFFLQNIEPVFPGLGALWNGRAAGSVPHRNPLWNCSYSYWRVGQYQTIAGYEAVSQGQVYFAGEHTSVDFQGWMEGAASSGVRAANEVISAAKNWSGQTIARAFAVQGRSRRG